MCVKIAPSTARKFHAILVKSVMRYGMIYTSIFIVEIILTSFSGHLNPSSLQQTAVSLSTGSHKT